MVIASSIYPWLKEQGFHITLYCQSGQGYDTAKNDPHVDRFIVQNRDAVPPQVLAQFWGHEKNKYTKWVNLSESMEATLLACPDRAQWEWPNELRAKFLDKNYVEFVHELAQVPPPYRPKFYSTESERVWAREKAKSYGKRNILWSLSGSSGHKAWPHLDSVIAAVLLEYPDVHFVLVGDDFCRILEQGWEKEPRVHCHSGKWSIRESLSFCEVANLILGTETGLLNAAGYLDVPKIINLSHSSEEMLTKHWRNTTVLRQPKGVGCNKQPCRQLHGSGGVSQWLDCPKHEETGTALCQFHIGPDVMMNAIRKVLD